MNELSIPPTAHLYYHLELCREKQGDAEQAYGWYERATATPEDPRTLMLQFTGYADYLSYLKLCALAWDIGHLDESREWNRLAGVAWPDGCAWKINEDRLR